MNDEMAVAADPESPRGTEVFECRTLVRSYVHLRVREPGLQARLLASLSDQGQTSPIVVVRDAEGRAVLIDGYRRVHALERLGKDTVIAIVLGLSEADALVYCHRLETSRRRSAMEDGWLLRELHAQGPKLNEIGRALGRTASWVSRRLGLVRALPESAEEAVRRGVVPPHGAMKSLVPLARANRTHCEQLIQHLGAERVTTREIAQLYAAWRSGDREQKERIVSAPRLFLRAARVVAPAEPHDEIGWLVRQLGIASEALARAGESLERATFVDPRVARNARVRRAWWPVSIAWEALRGKLEEEEKNAGPGDASCDLAATE
jgi:ParB family transcriptional regulator, chromosome partitioning protein